MAELSTPGIVQPLDGRLFVHLADVDGSTVFAHGLVVCPPGLQDHAQALAAIDRTFRDVVQRQPEDWNYDDLIAALEKQGFQQFCPAYWIETGADLASPTTANTNDHREPAVD